MGYLVPAAVIYSDKESHSGKIARISLYARHFLLKRGAQHRSVADKANTDIFLYKIANFVEIFIEKIHYSLDLIGRAFPIFGRKSIHGEILHAQLFSVAGDGAESLRALAVTEFPRQTAFFSPSAVAVHNNAYMRGHFCAGRQQRFFSSSHVSSDPFSLSFIR